MEKSQSNKVGLLAIASALIIGGMAFLGWRYRPVSPGLSNLPHAAVNQTEPGGAKVWGTMSTAEIAAWRRPIMDAQPLLRIDRNMKASEIAALLREGVVDSRGILDEREKQGLLLAIAEELLVRSDPDVDVYMAWADRKGTRWIGPGDDDRLWAVVGASYEGLFGTPPDRRLAREMCRAILGKARELERSRLAAIGVSGRFSLVIRPFETRLPGEIHGGHFEDGEESAYWQAWSTPATLQFRVPEPAPEQCLARDGVLKVALVGMLWETDAGHRFPTIMIWFLDREAGQWKIQSIYRKGGIVPALVY